MEDTDTLNTLKWLQICSTLLLLVYIFISVVVIGSIVDSYDAELQQLQERCQRLEQELKAHADIMITYQFFNEHWSAMMCGETGNIYNGVRK